MSIKILKEFINGKADAALIISEENVRYFTSFSSSNGYLLVTPNTAVFLTDSRYIEAAQNTVKTCDEVCEIKSVKETLSALVSNLNIKSIMVEQS